MISNFDKHFFNFNDIMEPRPRTSPNPSKSTGHQSTYSFKRSDLLLNLAFNLSKGHYNFVSELLKSKLAKQSSMDLNVNETVKYEHLKFEIKNSNKKFLLGKTPLILCNYVNENDWALSLAQLLVQNGAIVHLRDQCNGCSPLHYACALLKTEIIEFFLRNINQNLNYFIDNNGNSPLFYFLASYACLEHDKQVMVKENILETFKIYCNNLKHFNLKLNTRNRNGLSFFDLWQYLTMNNKFLLEDTVFKFALEAISGENPNVRKSKSIKIKSTSLIDLRLETGSDYYTLRSRTNIEIFLKRHLLIDLKNFKLIHHSIKVDNYLMVIFLNKVSPNDLPTNFCLIRSENGSDKNIEIYRKNINISMSSIQNYNNYSNEQDFLAEKNFNWRQKFGQLFNSLEIKNSESYRASAKCLIEVTREEHKNSHNISNHHQHHNHHHYHQANHNNHSQHSHIDSHQKTDLANSVQNKKLKNHSLIRK